jgi:ATP-binding cassette subfamily C protein CydD
VPRSRPATERGDPVKPLDPRLLRRASAARRFLVLGAGLGLLQTVSVVGVAGSASAAVVSVVEGTADRVLVPALVGLAVAVAVRSIAAWALEAVAARTAAVVKSQLRSQVVAAVARRGRPWLATRSSASVATLAGPGLDALDEWFASYLPQLVLTALATPVLVLVVLRADWLSAVIVMATLPLVPLFMVLIGWSTRAAQERQWSALTSLASSFLDAVNGLSTLKAFGREARQVARIGRITDAYRRETVSVLRVSFLSGFALELAASLSVALVAVSIGIRLVDGSLGLGVGLFVLLLAPEAFLPLRRVGAAYHAASDGAAAADEVFALLDDAETAPDSEAAAGSEIDAEEARVGSRTSVPVGSGTRAVARGDALVVDAVSVVHDGVPALAATTFTAPVGTVTAVVGPSGAGKSSLLDALRGAVPHGGRATWRDAGRAPDTGDVAWSGQAPGLVTGSVAENVALGDEIDPDLVDRALEAAGARGVDPRSVLGAGGSGLSGGQAQRVSVARALYRSSRRGCRLLLVDEPSAALDAVTEAALVAGLRRAAEAGAVVVVVTHRSAVRAAADQVVEIGSGAPAGAVAESVVGAAS